MIPIADLLNRIRWDPLFGAGAFEIGYYDRLQARVLRVPLREIWLEPEDRARFQLLDAEGVPHSIPLHRVRAVWKDGRLIWHREPPPGARQ